MAWKYDLWEFLVSNQLGENLQYLQSFVLHNMNYFHWR